MILWAVLFSILNLLFLGMGINDLVLNWGSYFSSPDIAYVLTWLLFDVTLIAFSIPNLFFLAKALKNKIPLSIVFPWHMNTGAMLFMSEQVYPRKYLWMSLAPMAILIIFIVGVNYVGKYNTRPCNSFWQQIQISQNCSDQIIRVF